VERITSLRIMKRLEIERERIMRERNGVPDDASQPTVYPCRPRRRRWRQHQGVWPCRAGWEGGQ
jgi:hypothetical protein